MIWVVVFGIVAVFGAGVLACLLCVAGDDADRRIEAIQLPPRRALEQRRHVIVLTDGRQFFDYEAMERS